MCCLVENLQKENGDCLIRTNFITATPGGKESTSNIEALHFLYKLSLTKYKNRYQVFNSHHNRKWNST